MPNAVYQRAVQKLEAIMPPRLASRSLHEGLGQLGKTPDTVAYDDLERIFKSTVYRHLQLSMPVAEAKTAVETILGELAETSADDASKTALLQQEEALEALKAAIKPFNLYFEWPETQKLRALLQLISQEQEAGRHAPALIADARTGLAELEQKLEDQLAHQAGALSELRSLFEEVKNLGGPKLRRLEGLIRSAEQAQEARALAGAELERARKLATDLRKLMASSVVVEDGEADALHAQLAADEKIVIDRATLTPEISARLLLIDLEAEKHELDMLRKEFRQLLDYQPELERVFDKHREALTTTSIGEALPAFRRSLEEGKRGLMKELQAEMTAMRARLPKFERLGLNAQELKVSLHIALGMLETTLPGQADILYARDLFRLLESQAREQEEGSSAPPAAKANSESQRGAFAKLKASLSRLGFGRSAEQAPTETATPAPARRQLEQELARLQTLLTRLQTLILRADAGPQAEALRVKLETMIGHATRGGLGETQLAAAEREFETLRESVRAEYRARLADLEARAQSLGDETHHALVSAAQSELDAGDFPDLESLGQTLKAALERRRAESIAELHRLEKDSQALRDLGDERLGELRALLGRARAAVESGGLAPDLTSGRTLLERIREDVQARVETFGQRLDGALARFAPLERLNTDDSLQVRRDLDHLQAQRPNFARLSLSLQSELEASLAQIEGRLKTLEQEFEAVRAISGQLVSTNALDDLLGGFDVPAEAQAPERRDSD